MTGTTAAEGDIRLRPIRSNDWRALQEFHRRLSPEAIRLRFHGYIRELSDEMAHRFCDVDGQIRVAFVAVTGVPERIVGVGRYDRVGLVVAEVAFVVEDAYQHRGVGTMLLERLIASARADGVKVFLARVLPGNNPMRHLLMQTGYPMRVDVDRDADSIWLTLQ
ncbi:MAG: hypothetical protein NVS4B2_10730 [Chloroflexota bacterium]